MKTGAAGVWLAAALAASGCAHEADQGTARGAQQAVAGSFEDAYEAVRTGAQKTVRWGAYVLDRTEEGVVRVYRAARGGGGQPAGGSTSDATVTSNVKGRLALDPALTAGRDIEVESDAGVVTLRGTVRGKEEATRAVQDALETEGVFAVNSELSWPAMQTGQRSVGSPPTEQP